MLKTLLPMREVVDSQTGIYVRVRRNWLPAGRSRQLELLNTSKDRIRLKSN